MHTSDESVKRIALAAFPAYTGRKFKLRIDEHIDVNNEWCGGSRDYVRFVSLDQHHRVVDTAELGAGRATLRDGIAAVVETIFCGKHHGLTVVVAPSNAAPLLSAPPELSAAERIVLFAARSLKSSYGGIRDLRFHEAFACTGIDRAAYDAAKASCIEKRMLNRAGAITNEGRNAIENVRSFKEAATCNTPA